MLKNKWFWIIMVILVIALGGGAYYYYTTQIAVATTTTQEAAMQTAVARLGDLVVSATGSGSVATAAQISVGFDEVGTLIELNVGLGDKVKAGDVLARLQTQNTPEEIAADISDAELNVIQAQQSLDELYANAETSRTEALNNIATYAQEVRDAQYALENYNTPLFLQGLGTVEAVDKMKEQLDAAWAAFGPYKYYPASDSTRYDLLVALNLAQSNYDAAVKRLNYEYVLDVAQANLDKARQDYARYESGPAKDELTLAEATLNNAKTKLALAKEKKSVVDLVAPINGTVMAVDAIVGGVVSEGTIITLADLDQLRVEAYLDESDLDKAKVGNEAEVVFDALPDRTFKGKVISVSPGLEEVSNVQAVKVIVQLDDISGVNLPIGLSATVDVISGRATDAVLIPLEALRSLDTDEYGVFVIEDGELVLRTVKVGLQDVTSVEIIDGVQAGETVSTGIVKSK